MGLGQKPGSKHGKSRQRNSTTDDVAIFGSTATVSVVTIIRAGVVAGSGSTVGGILRDPTEIAQGLVPHEVGLGRVGFLSAREEAGVCTIGVSVDGTDSCNVRVELACRLVTRVRVHRKVEGFLYRPTRVGGLLVNIQADVFRKTSVCLLRHKDENSCKCLDFQ